MISIRIRTGFAFEVDCAGNLRARLGNIELNHIAGPFGGWFLEAFGSRSATYAETSRRFAMAG